MIVQELDELYYKAKMYDEIQSVEFERLRSRDRFRECVKRFHDGFESIGVGKDYKPSPKPKKLKVIKTKKKKEIVKYPEEGLVRLRKFNPNKKVKTIKKSPPKKKRRQNTHLYYIIKKFFIEEEEN